MSSCKWPIKLVRVSRWLIELSCKCKVSWDNTTTSGMEIDQSLIEKQFFWLPKSFPGSADQPTTRSLVPFINKEKCHLDRCTYVQKREAKIFNSVWKSSSEFQFLLIFVSNYPLLGDIQIVYPSPASFVEFVGYTCHRFFPLHCFTRMAPKMARLIIVGKR